MAANEWALEPPDGVFRITDNPPNRDVSILAVGITSIIVATIFTSLRTYVRFFLIKRHGWEDYVLLLGWLLAVIYMAMMPYGLRYRVGVNQWNVPKDLYQKFLKGKNPGDIVYNLASCTLKTAIIIQLRRIFVVNKDRLYWVLITLGTVNILFYFSLSIARILACIPREKIWKPEVPGRCNNDAAAVLTSATVNVVLDFILFFIPVVKVWQLQMSGHNKAAVLPIFGVGIFACVASIMRTVESAKLLRSKDVTYMIADIAYWADAELATGIICCCLPVMPRLYNAHIVPFFSTVKSKVFSSHGLDSTRRDTKRSTGGGRGASAGLRSESETEIWSNRKPRAEDRVIIGGGDLDINDWRTESDQAIRMTTTFEMHDFTRKNSGGV